MPFNNHSAAVLRADLLALRRAGHRTSLAGRTALASRFWRLMKAPAYSQAARNAKIEALQIAASIDPELVARVAVAGLQNAINAAERGRETSLSIGKRS